eukprot:SAG25_NODE_9978_length_350_cov_0.573705_1_plen_46_part_01
MAGRVLGQLPGGGRVATSSEPDKLNTTPTVETVQRLDDLCASRLKD